MNAEEIKEHELIAMQLEGMRKEPEGIHVTIGEIQRKIQDLKEEIKKVEKIVSAIIEEIKVVKREMQKIDVGAKLSALETEHQELLSDLWLLRWRMIPESPLKHEIAELMKEYDYCTLRG